MSTGRRVRVSGPHPLQRRCRDVARALSRKRERDSDLSRKRERDSDLSRKRERDSDLSRLRERSTEGRVRVSKSIR